AAESGPLVGGQGGDVAPTEAHAATVETLQAGDGVEERCLAGAVGADEPDDRALRHLQGHTAQGLQTAEGQARVVDLEHVHATRLRVRGAGVDRVAIRRSKRSASAARSASTRS